MTLIAVAAAIALLACLTLSRAAPLAVRLLRPAHAVVAVSVASFAVSLAAGIALTSVGVAMVAGLTFVAEDGHWSAATLRTSLPVPGWLGGLSALVVLVLLMRAATRTAAIAIELVRANRVCRDLRADSPIVVVDDESADAYTIAGLRGCVIISSRLLNALTEDERRVLTAHELSHLRRRHHLYVHLVDIAAAANPLLRPVVRAIRLGVERWADEDAALVIGDRRRAGRHLAEIALRRSALAAGPESLIRPSSRPWRRPGLPGLGVAALQVVNRVQALLDPAPRPRPGRAAATVLAALLVLAIGLTSLLYVQDVIEEASFFIPGMHPEHR